MDIDQMRLSGVQACCGCGVQDAVPLIAEACELKGAVLLGSRRLGLARSDSDWDFSAVQNRAFAVPVREVILDAVARLRLADSLGPVEFRVTSDSPGFGLAKIAFPYRCVAGNGPHDVKILVVDEINHLCTALDYRRFDAMFGEESEYRFRHRRGSAVRWAVRIAKKKLDIYELLGFRHQHFFQPGTPRDPVGERALLKSLASCATEQEVNEYQVLRTLLSAGEAGPA